MLKRNNFSGGPAGTTITTVNSSQSGDDGFSGTAKVGANTVLQFTSAVNRPTAEFMMEASTGAAAGQSVVYYTSLAAGELWSRMYFYYTVTPNNFLSPAFFYAEDISGAKMFEISTNSSGVNEIIVSNWNDSVTNKTTAGITAGHWYRVEVHVVFSATVGSYEMRWFDNADSDTPTETLTGSGQNFKGSSCQTVYYGYINSDSTLEAMWVSGLELNDSGWPGPAPFHAGKGVPGVLTNPMAIHTATW